MTPQNFDLKNFITQARNKGVSDDEILKYVKDKGLAPQVNKEEPKGITAVPGRIAEDISSRVKKLKEASSEQSVPETIFQGAGNVVGAGFGTLFEGAKGAYESVASEKAQQNLAQSGQKLVDSPVGQKVLAPVGEAISSFTQAHPRATRNIEAGIDIASVLPIGKLAKQGLTLVGKGGKTAIERALKVGAESSVSKIPEIVKAIPEVVKKAELIGSDVVEGAKNIAGNVKQNLKETVVESARKKGLPFHEITAIDKGVPEPVIEFLKTSEKADLPAYKEMIDIAERNASNPRIGEQAKEVAGKTILEKGVVPVIKSRDIIGKFIGKIRESLPTVQEDITGIKKQFLDVLEKVGVTETPILNKKGEIIGYTLKGGKGAVQGDLVAYKNMYNRIKSGVASLRDLHDIREAIFKEFSLAKARLKTFSPQADTVAETFRTILSKPISAVNKSYMPLNIQYAKTMQALNDFVKLTGYTGDIEKITAQSLKVGEIAQRVLGNASARPQEVIDAIVRLADATADQTLKKSIMDQIRFSDIIEDFIPSSQTRSLKAGIQRGTQDAAEGLVGEVMTKGPISGTVSSGLKFLKGMASPTQKMRTEALKDLLNILSED